MKIKICFCTYFRCNACNIYGAKKYLEQKLCRKMKHTFYAQHTHSLCHMVFKIIKQHTRTVKQCTFLNLFFAGSWRSAAVLLSQHLSVQWQPLFRLRANWFCLKLKPRSWRLVPCVENCCSADNILLHVAVSEFSWWWEMSSVRDTEGEYHRLNERRANVFSVRKKQHSNVCMFTMFAYKCTQHYEHVCVGCFTVLSVKR
jgi:hypothetical protein